MTREYIWHGIISITCHFGYNIVMKLANDLKIIREKAELTQAEAAALVGIPYRTYCRYETTEEMKDSFKYRQMVSVLEEKTRIDEEHGLSSIAKIKEAVRTTFAGTSVEVCYLFGSYAKGKEKETSDIDLMVSGVPEGLSYFLFEGQLQSLLHKKIDLIRLDAAAKNPQLMNEILKDGIKIYG